MEPQRIYDYLALSRRKIFDWIRPLPASQWEQDFAIGRGSLARTLTHIETSEWYYVQRMRGRAVPPFEQWPIREETPLPLAALETAWAEQAERTRVTLAAVRDWNAELEYEVTTDDGVRQIVTASPSGIFTQLALHEVHHRAQAMNMLRHLGAAVDDIDFNVLMYGRRAASA